MPPFRSQCICLLLLLLLPLGAPEIAVADSAAPPEDADAIQSGMEQILVSLDAAAYAKSVSYAEHVVIAYQRAQHREPTPEEFIVLSVRQGRPIFKRSEVLAMALRRDEAALTWDQCREFLKKRTPKDFRSSAATRAIARQLAKTSLSSVTQKDILKKACFPQPAQGRKAKTAPVIPGEEYNVYFGYTHAHSGLSDGSGTPEEAYAYARDEGDLDFFSLTDHAEQLELWPWENKWQRLKCAAEAVYAPGTFVSLWGFEWANPLVGHINVINSTGLTSVLDSFFLPELYGWLTAEPEAIGIFNHPGNCDDLGIEFRHMEYFTDSADQIVGIEIANSNDSFERYYYSGGWETAYSYWDEGNLKGWKLGPVVGQDNHGPDWGTKNPWRTAVLAKELTREAIIDAYRHRRFYATEDPGLHLDFRCAGYPMGSSLLEVPAEFTVDAATDAAAAFEQIRLYRNGELLETRPVSGNPVQAIFSDPVPLESAYYYVIVTETVDRDSNGRKDEAITAPIWIGEPWGKPACGATSLFCQPVGDIGTVGDLFLLISSLIVLIVTQTLAGTIGNNSPPKSIYEYSE